MVNDINQTYLELGEAMDTLRRLTNETRDAELAARAARAAATVAESVAFLRSEGPETTRRHMARVDDDKRRADHDADVAESHFNHMKRRMDGCKENIRALMAEGSYQKEALRTLGHTPDTWT